MVNIWFISDTHFNHANILKFTTYDGHPCRPGFENVEHMNEVMIERWNKKVAQRDKIYHLGDIAFGRPDDYQKIMARLNGEKRLVMGNHDHFDMHNYTKYYRIEPCWRQFKDMAIPFICSHAPLHPDEIRADKKGRKVYNVHGHTHNNIIKQHGSQVPDDRYVNICVEHTDYTPIHIDELLKRMK
jgi:calcineurin-like phosphoesterase family protein